MLFIDGEMLVNYGEILVNYGEILVNDGEMSVQSLRSCTNCKPPSPNTLKKNMFVGCERGQNLGDSMGLGRSNRCLKSLPQNALKF